MPIEREHCVKGGKNVPSEKRGFSVRRDLAAEAGRKGGKRQGERCKACEATRRRCVIVKRNGAIACCKECSHFERE